MKSHFFTNLKKFKIICFILTLACLFNNIAPAWAREGNYGNTSSLESFAGGVLAGAVTDAAILLCSYAAAQAAAASAAAPAAGGGATAGGAAGGAAGGGAAGGGAAGGGAAGGAAGGVAGGGAAAGGYTAAQIAAGQIAAANAAAICVAGNAASDITGYLLYRYNYNEYAEPMFEIGGVTVTKGQFYSMIAGVIVSAGLSYAVGASQAAKEAGKEAAKEAAKKTAEEAATKAIATEIANAGSKVTVESMKSAAKKAVESLPKEILDALGTEGVNQVVDSAVSLACSSLVENAVVKAVTAAAKEAGSNVTTAVLEKAASEAVNKLPADIIARVGERSVASIKESVVKGVLGNLSTFDIVVGKIESLLHRFSQGYGMRNPYLQYGIKGSLKEAFTQIANDIIVGTFKIWTQNGIKLKLEEAGWDELLAELVSQLGASIAGTFVNQIVSNLAFSALDAISDRAAANDKVKVTRQGPDGKVETVEMTIQELSQGKTAKGSSLQEAIAAGEIGEKTLVLKIGESIYKIDIDMNKGSVYRTLMQYVGSYSLSAVGGALDQADATMLNAVNQAQQVTVRIKDSDGKEHAFTAEQLNKAAVLTGDGKKAIALSDVAQNKALEGILQPAKEVMLVIPNGGNKPIVINVSGQELAQAQLSTLNLLTQAHVNTAVLLNATGGLMTDVQGNTMSGFGTFTQALKAVQNIGLAPLVNLGVKLAVLSAMGYKSHYGDDDDKIFDNLVKRVASGAIAGFASGAFSNIDVLNTWYSGTRETGDNPWKTKGNLSMPRYLAQAFITNAVDAGLQIAWGQYCRVNEIRQPQALQELLHLASGVVAGSVIDALFLRAPAKDMSRLRGPDNQTYDLTREALAEAEEKQGAKKVDVQVYIVDGKVMQLITTGDIVVVDLVPKKEDEKKEKKDADKKPVVDPSRQAVKTRIEFQKEFARDLVVSLQQKSSETSASNNAPMRVGLSSSSGEIQYYHVVGYSQDSNSVELESEGTTKKKISMSLEDLSANVVQYGSGQALKGVSIVTGVLLGASTPGGQRTFMTPEDFNQQAKSAGVILRSLDGEKKEVSLAEWAAIGQAGPSRSVEYYRFAGDKRMYVKATDQGGNASSEHVFISTDGHVLEMSEEEFGKSIEETGKADVYDVDSGEFIFAGLSQRSPLQLITLPGYEINGVKYWAESTADPLVILKSPGGDVHYAPVSQIRQQGGTVRSESTGEFELDADTARAYVIKPGADTRRIIDIVNEEGAIIDKKEIGTVILSSEGKKDVELTPEEFRTRTREISRTVYGLNIDGTAYTGEIKKMPSLGEDPISKGRINFSMRDILGRYIPATLENLGDNFFLSAVNATLFPVNLRTPISGMNGLQARFNEQERFIQYMQMRSKGYSPLQANRALILESLSQQANSRLASSVSAVFTNPILPRSSLRTYASFKPTGELVEEEMQRRKALREQAERFIETASGYKPDTAEQIVSLEAKKTEIADQVNKKEKKKKEYEADPIYAAYQDLQQAKAQGLDPDANTISIVVATNAQSSGVYVGEEEQAENIRKLAGQSMNRDALGAEEIRIFEDTVKDFVSIQDARIKGLRDQIYVLEAPLPEINKQIQDLSIPRQEIFQWVVAAQGLTPVYGTKLPDSAPATPEETTQGWALRDRSVYFSSPKGEDNWMMNQGLPAAIPMAQARQKEYSVYDASIGHGQIGGIYHYQRRDEAVGMNASLNPNEALFMRHFNSSSSAMLRPQDRGVLGKYLSLPNIGDGVVNSTYSLSVAGGLPLDQLTYGRSVVAQPVMQVLTQDMLSAQNMDIANQDEAMQEQFDKIVERMQLPDTKDEEAVQAFNAEKETLLALPLEEKKVIIRKFSSARPVFFSPVTSLLSRTRIDLWGRARSTEYFGQEFVSEKGQDPAKGNWSLVQLPKTTEYYYGPFGLALTKSTDYTAITPPEYEQKKTLVMGQTEAPKAEPKAPVKPEHVWEIKPPELPSIEDDRRRINSFFGKKATPARMADEVQYFLDMYEFHSFSIDTVREELYEPNKALMEELDPYVEAVNKATGRKGKQFSREVTSWGATLLYFLSSHENYTQWKSMSEEDRVEFVRTWTGFDRALGSAHKAGGLELRVPVGVDGQPIPGAQAGVYDRGNTGGYTRYRAPGDPGVKKKERTDVFGESTLVWLPVIRTDQAINPPEEVAPPAAVPTLEVKESGYTPVSVGPNIDYNYNFYSIGQGHSPYGNPSYSWRPSEIHSGPALQPYMYVNTSREAAFLRDKGKRIFEEALNAAYAGENKPTFDAAIPNNLTDEIWQIAQSVVVDFKQFEASKGDGAQEQKDLPLTKRDVFDRFNAERARVDKPTSGELFDNLAYMQQVREISAPANVVWQSGVYKYTRFNTEETVPMLQWGVSSGLRAGDNLQLAPAFTLSRNGVYNRENLEANICVTYKAYTDDIAYLRGKSIELDTLIDTREHQWEQVVQLSGKDKELRELEEAIKKAREELQKLEESANKDMEQDRQQARSRLRDLEQSRNLYINDIIDQAKKKDSEQYKAWSGTNDKIAILSEELGRWQDPVQSAANLEAARDRLLRIQLVDMGNGVTLVQDNPEDLTLGAAYEGYASIILPPAWNVKGMPQAFVKPLIGDDAVGYMWDYLKPKPSNDPNVSAPTETNKPATVSASGETREEF